MSLYTNRALANLHLKNYDKVIDDCTSVLDYCECFEEGYLESKVVCFKAFIRRSTAYMN